MSSERQERRDKRRDVTQKHFFVVSQARFVLLFS